MVALWLCRMARIPLKGVPKEPQLKNKASALTTRRDQKWIDEAIASGAETPLTKKEMNAIRDRVLRGKK
jgi:hypothetical protein